MNSKPPGGSCNSQVWFYIVPGNCFYPEQYYLPEPPYCMRLLTPLTLLWNWL